LKVKLSRDDIVLGKPIPWNLYSEKGTLLFKKGIVINNSASLGKLLHMDLYHDYVDKSESTQNPGIEKAIPGMALDRMAVIKSSENKIDPFDQINKIADSIKIKFDTLATGKPLKLHAIMHLAEEVRLLYDTHPDESLAAVHLSYDHEYSCLQPLYCAILSEMIAKDLGFPLQTRRSLVAAALTANVGMYEYYNQLTNQNSALNEYQKKMIHSHPEKSCDILKKSGLHDSLWLTIIEQHHERPDGSGYPRGLKDGQIRPEAILVSMVDFYLSLIMPRAYRDPILSREALQRIYKTASEDDKTIISTFIRQLGIYPPGTFVKLSNNEVAIVTRRSHENAIHPKVVSIGKVKGSENFNPMVRNIMGSGIRIEDAYLFDIRQPLDLQQIWSLQ